MWRMFAAADRRVVVAITGASGVGYGVRMLELLAAEPTIETHLIVSAAGALTIRHELDRDLSSVVALADVVHRPASIGASIASGSFETAGMVVAPCSIKTLSAIANCYSDSLISRAADVHLKEGRPLVLLVRESPLHLGHLRLMTAATEAGATIAPPVPAMYARPTSVDDVIDHTARRALARLGLEPLGPAPWRGLEHELPRDT
ncbi:MAG: 3-octaprenyl-4-hydroxybenzoate carboxy-lyase [Solirubrobacterales bacterium]|nr:3-octaprenyl-4-hydroxybenzoate carboxy-lyase [Solirubrobacterales bacterium]